MFGPGTDYARNGAASSSGMFLIFMKFDSLGLYKLIWEYL
jgi:hypothetical protein